MDGEKFLRKIRLLVLGLVVLTISGCASKEEAVKRTDLAKGDELLVNSFKREKGFSVYEFPDLEKAEAEEVLQEDLKLELPGFLDQINKLVEEHLVTDDQKIEGESYSIASVNEEASYINFFAVKNNENLYPMSATSQIIYSFRKSEEKAFFDNYKLRIDNSAATEKYNGADLEKFLLSLGEAINIQKEDFQGELQLTLGKTAEELENQQVVLYDTFDKAEEKGSLGKKIVLVYAESGVLAKIQLYLQDFYRS